MTTTMRDVAQKAGVSIKTVSRVVNNQGEISEETRQRVLMVIDELGYRPNMIARGLVTQQTYAVGLLVGDITNPFFPEVARGVLETARLQSYNVFLCNTNGDPQQELDTLQSLAAHAVDGIIIYPSYDSIDNIKRFAEHYQPIVGVNLFLEQPGLSQVIVKNQPGSKLAVDYLVNKGHRAIAMLTGVLNPTADKVRRIQGFKEALAGHGLPVVDEWLIPSPNPSFESGYEAARQLLINHPQITAIFAYNDLLALGALKACAESGRRVPGDCAVVGFDDIEWAAKSTPALTTLRVDKYDLGRQAMTRLLAMLDNPDGHFPPIYLDVELVIRESA